MLQIAYNFADSAEKALLYNANIGGDNISRGALIGSLFGASFGMKTFPVWTKDQLIIRDDIYLDNQNFILM